jgi:hypothetical protein
MRPTDFCHLNDLRVPVPRAFPAHYATFTAWTPHGVLGSVRSYWGTECFTTLENASADRHWPRSSHLASLLRAPSFDRMRELGAWASYSHGASETDRASGTSVASPSSAGLSERLRDSF